MFFLKTICSCFLIDHCRYKLDANSSVFAEEKYLPIYKELVEKYSDNISYIAGGTALNAARVAQWILQTPKVVTFVGGIGKDRFGEILKQKAEDAGVNAHFECSDSQPTGTCAVICTGSNRSMVSNQAAASCFTEECLGAPHNLGLVEAANIFYTVSFSLAVNPSVLMHLAKQASEKDKTFCFNLGAPFLCRKFKEHILSLVPYIDILFGNITEAIEFANTHNFETTDLGSIATKIAAQPKQVERRPRVVVITQGSQPVLVATDGKVTEYQVSGVPEDEIVDTTGAGDAFVGGFLARLTEGLSIADCVQSGIYASSVIIRQPGCSLPDRPKHSQNTCFM